MRKYVSKNLIEQKFINDLFLEDHDRYFIIEETQLYHCSSSINRIGYKTFSITKINDKDVCNALIEKIDNITLKYSICYE